MNKIYKLTLIFSLIIGAFINTHAQVFATHVDKSPFLAQYKGTLEMIEITPEKNNGNNTPGEQPKEKTTNVGKQVDAIITLASDTVEQYIKIQLKDFIFYNDKIKEMSLHGCYIEQKGKSLDFNFDQNFEPDLETSNNKKINFSNGYIDDNSTIDKDGNINLNLGFYYLQGRDINNSKMIKYQFIGKKNPGTSIKRINRANNHDNVYYNLQGIKVNNPIRGEIYIINHKKVIFS